MIEKVYVLNLPHRVDRRHYMIGHLHTIGVPPHVLHFLPAKYHADYESHEAIRKAAIADGFTVFENERWKNEPNKFQIAYHWGWACILRQVIEDNSNALIMIDDRTLKIDFQYLNLIVNRLEEDYPPFYLLQLGWWIGPNGSEWMMSLGLRGKRYKDEDLINGLIAKGTGGLGDFATVISPEGAQVIMDYLGSPLTGSIEWYLGYLGRPDQDKSGMFHFIQQMVDNAHVDWETDSIWL